MEQHASAPFNGVKVFTATTANDREDLGGRVSQWLRLHPEVEVVDTAVRQSSDDAYHCVTIVVFYRSPVS